MHRMGRVEFAVWQPCKTSLDSRLQLEGARYPCRGERVGGEFGLAKRIGQRDPCSVVRRRRGGFDKAEGTHLVRHRTPLRTPLVRDKTSWLWDEALQFGPVFLRFRQRVKPKGWGLHEVYTLPVRSITITYIFLIIFNN